MHGMHVHSLRNSGVTGLYIKKVSQRDVPDWSTDHTYTWMETVAYLHLFAFANFMGCLVHSTGYPRHQRCPA